MPTPDPRVWTEEELEEARLLAIGDYIAGRSAEGPDSYASMLATAISEVERLLTATNDLTALGVGAALVADSSLIAPLRYTAGPPISESDLAVMADVSISAKKLTAAQAEAITIILTAARDTARFPWMDATPPVPPDATTRRLAVVSTATLWAAQKMATKRRTESSTRQEAAVRALLTASGFVEVPTRSIDAPGDLGLGEFCAESLVAGSKADVSVRLRNGRLLLIECKVSGSAINSVKRLNREVGNKRETWRTAFGAQAYTMAVLAGVFRLKNLSDAQTKGIFIVWERDLAPLATFVAAAIP